MGVGKDKTAGVREVDNSPKVPETMSILCIMLSLSPTPAPWAPYRPTA